MSEENKVSGRFNRNTAKETEQQSMAFDGPADSSGIEIKSPGKQHWVRARGNNYDDILKVWTTVLFDPDGEEVEYMIQTDDPDLRLRIFDKCDDNQNYRALVPCVNWFDNEFLWIPTIKPKGGSKVGAESAKIAINKIQQQWCKVKWRSNAVGWVTKKHPGSEKQPVWSNMTEDEIIDQVFKGKIIESLDHEALLNNNR